MYVVANHASSFLQVPSWVESWNAVHGVHEIPHAHIQHVFDRKYGRRWKVDREFDEIEIVCRVSICGFCLD